MKDDWRNNWGPERVRLAVATALLWTLVFILFLVGFSSCKITRQSKTDYQYQADGYKHVEYVHDTVYVEKNVEIHDTVTVEVERENTTGVDFVESGGTYNVQTGEMTGVKSVKTTEREKTLENRIESLSQRLVQSEAHVSALEDSLVVISAFGSEETFSETKAQNFWWVWLCIGLVGGAGTIIALKKIPYTKPLMLWL